MGQKLNGLKVGKLRIGVDTADARNASIPTYDNENIARWFAVHGGTLPLLLP